MGTKSLLLFLILGLQLSACAQHQSQHNGIQSASPTIAEADTTQNDRSQTNAQQQPVESDWINHLKLQGSITLFSGPSATAHQSFTDLINGAQKSVFMEMYHLTDKDVISKVDEAAKRGIKVDLILDGATLKKPQYSKISDEMSGAGASVYASTPKFSITHSKAMIVDGNKAIISSMNLTDRPEVRRDFGIILEDQGVIAEMQKVFETDIANSKNSTGDTPVVSDPHLLWSPVNAAQKLHDLIGSAQHSIVAIAENVLDQDLINDLIAADKRGVNVRVISPACSMGQDPHRNYLAAKQLVAGGVDARQMPNPSTAATPYEHGKMMVIDGIRAYVGSVNYSHSSEFNSRELGLAFEDQAVATQLSMAFDADFSHSKAPGNRVWNCPAFPSGN